MGRLGRLAVAWALGACGALGLAPLGVAHAQEDGAAEAQVYAEGAIAAAEGMYLDTEFVGADEVLMAAVARCEKEGGCDEATVVRLNVLHAEVLVSGLKRRDEARAAMRRALVLDRELKLDREVDSKALFALRAEVLEELGPEAPAAGDDDDDGGEGGDGDGGGDGSGDGSGEVDVRRNWVRVEGMVDLTLLLAEGEVCSASGQVDQGWVCSRADGSRYGGVPAAGQQNAEPTAMRLSTIRATLGYERVLGDNFTLGVRVGFAFRAQRTGDDEDFLPAHAEGRAAYWFGEQPFKSWVRPHLFVAAGLGEVITPSELTVVEDGAACAAVEPISGDCTRVTDPLRQSPERRVQRLEANKLAGPGFAALGFGLSFSPTPLLMLDLAVRASATFPVFSLVLVPEAGLSFGF